MTRFALVRRACVNIIPVALVARDVLMFVGQGKFSVIEFGGLPTRVGVALLTTGRYLDRMICRNLVTRFAFIRCARIYIILVALRARDGLMFVGERKFRVIEFGGLPSGSRVTLLTARRNLDDVIRRWLMA